MGGCALFAGAQLGRELPHAPVHTWVPAFAVGGGGGRGGATLSPVDVVRRVQEANALPSCAKGGRPGGFETRPYAVAIAVGGVG